MNKTMNKINKVNKTIISIAACSFSVLSSVAAAQSFQLRQASELYDAKIEVQCQQSECEGPAKITLYHKGSQQIFQDFQSDDLTMYLGKNQQPSVNVIQLYDEQSALIFDDFNFDGSQDLAIRNGNYGSYGGPTYDVYVFHRNKQQFVYSDELSSLTQENLGMFQTDSEKKRIITFNKSGCCYHIRSEYQVVPRQGLQLVREFIEDITSSEGHKVQVTDRKLIKGKWQQSVKYYPVEEYYKE